MYRGDDIYLLDFWPLDNLNTVGGGARYDFTPNTYLAAHYGLSQPSSDFFTQSVTQPQPFNNPGAANVLVLNRQELEGSLKLSHIMRVGETGGVKNVLYSEIHQLPAGCFQLQTQGQFEERCPAISAGWRAPRSAPSPASATRTSTSSSATPGGLAAYGGTSPRPTSSRPDKTTIGARELVVALWLRQLRGRAPSASCSARTSAIVPQRQPPTSTSRTSTRASSRSARTSSFGELGRHIGGRGIVPDGSSSAAPSAPPPTAPRPASSARAALTPSLLAACGLLPFLTPARRRRLLAAHQIRLIYAISARNRDAKALYPQDDAFSIRTHRALPRLRASSGGSNSTSYGG